MKWVFWIAVIAVLAVAAGAIYMRTLAHDAKRWNIDPRGFALPAGTQNAALKAGTDALRFDAPPSVVAAEIKRMALSQHRTTHLAGSPTDMPMTFVETSGIMAYPDYISVLVTAEGTGSAVHILSRSRFGKSDLGVNDARLKRWSEQLETVLANAPS